MENALVAFVVIFVVLFGGLTLAEAIFSSENMLQGAQQEMEAHWDMQLGTQLSPTGLYTANSGATIWFPLKNTGTTRLIDFEQWDIVIQYYDALSSGAYHVDWMPYSTDFLPGTWGVEGIYLDASEGTGEVYDRKIFDPGEEVRVKLNVSPPVAPGTQFQILLVTSDGSSASMISMGNTLPVLVTNAELAVGAGGTAFINDGLLLVTDGDASDNLTYTVTSLPTQGNLSQETFTQKDINDGVLTYAHTGTGTDSFEFMVSDGKDMIGPYTFNISINTAPVVEANTGVPVTKDSLVVIGTDQLNTTDSDNSSSELIYRITSAPTQGILSLGETFTQNDIDNGRLFYTHMGVISDRFEFTVSDGISTVGPYTFTLNLQ